MKSKLKLKNIIKEMNLKIIAGSDGLDKAVENEMICRPGMEFAGFFDFYESNRIILIGTKESSFFASLDEKIARERLNYLFLQKPPAFVFSKNVAVPEIFIELGNLHNIAVLKSDLKTTAISSKLYSYLQELLAERVCVHGTLLDINGMGTLIIGKSGIGKSETALDLIKRGHQLISDDLVEIVEKEPGNLIGMAPEILRRYIEIRGIGIVDVVKMFGAAAYRTKKSVRLVVELEKWDQDKYYDRLGLETEKIKYFDTEITKILIPVLPGRNVALLVEAAAMNEKLKIFGYFSAKEFTDRVNKLAAGEENYDNI